MKNISSDISNLDDIIDWEPLLECIKEARCVICIGPDVFNEFDEESTVRLEHQLADFLRAQEDQLKIRVYENGWFNYQPGADEVKPYYRIKDFYQRARPKAEKILSTVARIPFHLLLYFNPDYKLKEAFERQDFKFSFTSYKKNLSPDLMIKVPTKEEPLVYNFLGELKEKNSLILTYKDYYDYLKSVMKGKSMSDELKRNLFEADYFIFLGLPFDRWYVHLLMHELNQHENKSSKYSFNSYLNSEIITHCTEQYTMAFIPNEVSDFVDKLYEKCENIGLLRKPPVIEQAVHKLLDYAKLRAWLMQGETDKVFDDLAKNLEGTDYIKEIDSLEAQHEELKRKDRRGTLSSEEHLLQGNIIRGRILDLFESLQKRFPDTK